MRKTKKSVPNSNDHAHCQSIAMHMRTMAATVLALFRKDLGQGGNKEDAIICKTQLILSGPRQKPSRFI